MGWIILIIIVFGICIYVGLSTGKQIEEKNKKEYLEKGYHFVSYCGVEYKGGIKNISINTPIIINLLEEGLSFNNATYEKVILFKDIKDIILQNKQYIENQVSLGKLIVFGVFALGMSKNQKNINDEYIILKINEENEEYNVLLQACDYTNNQSVYDKIVMYKNLKESV